MPLRESTMDARVVFGELKSDLLARQHAGIAPLSDIARDLGVISSRFQQTKDRRSARVVTDSEPL